MALLITLAMVTLTSIMLVTFVTMMQQDKAATTSYSQSAKTSDLALGALQLIVEDFRKEMRQGGDPDLSYASRPLFTNLTSHIMQPVPFGTNAAMRSLIRISTNQPAFSSSALRSTTLSTTLASRNGRFLSTNRWSKPQLGRFPSDTTVPYWILVTRAGLTNGLGLQFGTTGGTLNNASYSNTNYAIGRVAYAIYDVGGLLDITVAGHPSSLTSAQIKELKGTLAAVDLSQIKDSSGASLIDPDKLIAWRNAATGQLPGAYLNHVTTFASTNGFRKTAQGDSTFINRQDLIKAAQSQRVGISTNALPYLTTFTRDSGIPTWRPTQNAPAGNKYNYKDNANNTSSTNCFLPLIRHATGGTVPFYHSDGRLDSYTVKAGDPLLRRRFPLDRLKWMTRTGPKSGIDPQAIRSCFGLEWTASSVTPGARVWKYVGSTSAVNSNPFSTLKQVADETDKREPNFFELLQAGILNGSLGYYGGSNQQLDPKGYEAKSALQLCRIVANIIDQYDEDTYPTIIECPVYSMPYQISGVESLPCLNVYKNICAASASGGSLTFYGLPGLWNPHQSPADASKITPKIRLSFVGTILSRCNWATTLIGNPMLPEAVGIFGENTSVSFTSPASIELKSNTPGKGVLGFAEPALLGQLDVSGSVNGNNPGGGSWELTPALGNTLAVLKGNQYVGLRLKEMPLELTAAREKIVQVLAGKKKPSDVGVTGYADLTSVAREKERNMGEVATRMTDGQLYLEYEQSAGVWVPYSFLFGMNTKDRSTWVSKPQSAFSSGHNPWRSTVQPNYIDLTVLANVQQTGTATFDQVDAWGENGSLHYQKVDPLCIRIIPSIFIRWLNGNTTSTNPSGTPQMKNVGILPLWATASQLNNLPGSSDESKFAGSGYGAADWDRTREAGVDPSTTANPQMRGVPTNIAGSGANNGYFPATLCRNAGIESKGNNYTGNTVIKDPDGTARLADNGLYGSPTETGPEQGNPYRNTQDRPVRLDRPFLSVADLGYVLRDNPWRSLNFFTEDSADAGLLDLFSLHEVDDNSASAGKLDLNTQNTTVLAAVLNTATPQAGAIAQSLTAFTNPNNNAQGPLINKAGLVTQLFDKNNGLAEFKNIKLKSAREEIIRTLADIGQVGTWNLMIDLVAQSGKYPTDASRLEHFIVEGEQRLWLHVALNRFTGEVVDQQIEIVTE